MVEIIDKLMFDYTTKNIKDNIISEEELLPLKNLCASNNFLNLYDNICKDIYSLIYKLTYESIIKEYQNYKKLNLIVGNNRKSRIELFIEKYAKKSEFATVFLKKYPVLKYLLRERISDFLRLVIEIIKNYINDRNSVENLFGKKFGIIKKISLSMGDLHNGKTVSIVIFENGKLVYKPHNANTDKFIKEIINFVSSGIQTNYSFYFPKCLSFNNYCWQEFIQRKDCTSMKEVHNYYYRAGIYLAVFHILSTNDLHFENMISYGEYPVFIDLETIIRSESSKLIKSQNCKTFYNSVLATGMLPLNIENDIIDVNMSSLFTGKHKSHKLQNIYVIPDDDFDWIFTKKKIIMGGSDNNLLLNGHEVQPWIVEKDIINGFKDAFNFICDNKEKLKKIINNIGNDCINIRQVLRPTQVYAKFIYASIHPDLLMSFEEYNSLFNILYTNFTVGAHGFLRVEKEISDLKKGYIPLFYTLFNEKNLYSDNKIICDNYFAESPRETLLRRIESFNKESINYQIRFIQMSFLTLYGPREIRSPLESINYKFEGKELSYDFVKKVLQEYARYVISNLVPIENNNWSIIVPMVKGDNFIIQNMESELYQMGGLIWFLGVYSKFFDSNYTIYPRGMLKALFTNYTKGKLVKNRIFNYSIYSGVGSLLYLTYNFYKLCNDKYYFDSFQQIALDIISHYVNVSLSEKIDTDFFHGLPGILFVLSKIYLDEIKTCKKECAITKENLSVLGDKFYDLISTISNNCYGFLHGISGLEITTAILYKITNNKKYTLLLKKLLLYESELSSDNTKNFSWCQGKSGVLLARYIMLEYIDNNELCKLIKDSMPDYKENNIEAFFNMNQLCICHGIYGNIDIFNSIMKKTGQTFFKNLLYKKYFDSLTKVKWFEHSNYKYESFMLGSSGVAYVLMRLYKDIPSVLSLDIYSENHI